MHFVLCGRDKNVMYSGLMVRAARNCVTTHMFHVVEIKLLCILGEIIRTVRIIDLLHNYVLFLAFDILYKMVFAANQNC